MIEHVISSDVNCPQCMWCLSIISFGFLVSGVDVRCAGLDWGLGTGRSTHLSLPFPLLPSFPLLFVFYGQVSNKGHCQLNWTRSSLSVFLCINLHNAPWLSSFNVSPLFFYGYPALLLVDFPYKLLPHYHKVELSIIFPSFSLLCLHSRERRLS